MKYLILIVAVFIAGCEVAVVIRGPSPPLPCDGILIPGKGCVKDANTATLSDRGFQEQSPTVTEPVVR